MEKEMFDRQDVLTELHNGVCTVTFEKVNGDFRVMKATLHPSYLPQPVVNEETQPVRKVNPDVCTVWDTEVNDWRAFRFDSIKEFV
tara:strand:- start:6976 stop:7233 length:258 start_codon:yes stop_codon:yes gene_type:complete